jgi:hypothetical protein
MKKTVLLALLSFSLSEGMAQNTPATSTTENKPKRYLGMVELGYLHQKKQNDPLTAPTLTVFNGFQFHRLLSVGPTVGLDFYENLIITPVALGLRGTLLDKRVSPFYSVDAGYGTTWFSDEPRRSEHKGGWMINPAAGLRIKAGNETAFLISLGYKVQSATTKEPLAWDNSAFITRDLTFKRLSTRIGFMF